MKKYTVTITESDIRSEIEAAVSELEQDRQIAFPHSEARSEFIEDCVRSEIDRIELYDTCLFFKARASTYSVGQRNWCNPWHCWTTAA